MMLLFSISFQVKHWISLICFKVIAATLGEPRAPWGRRCEGSQSRMQLERKTTSNVMVERKIANPISSSSNILDCLTDQGRCSRRSRTRWSWPKRVEFVRGSPQFRDCKESTWEWLNLWQSKKLTWKLRSQIDPSQRAWWPSSQCWLMRPPF